MKTGWLDERVGAGAWDGDRGRRSELELEGSARPESERGSESQLYSVSRATPSACIAVGHSTKDFTVFSTLAER